MLYCRLPCFLDVSNILYLKFGPVEVIWSHNLPNVSAELRVRATVDVLEDTRMLQLHSVCLLVMRLSFDLLAQSGTFSFYFFLRCSCRNDGGGDRDDDDDNDDDNHDDSLIILVILFKY